MSIPTRSHVEIAQDELDGLKDLGYPCESFSYAARENISSTLGRFFVVLNNAFSLVVKAYQFKADIIYFNSRLEIIASTRDFLTILIVKALYWRKVLVMIKSHGSDLEVLAYKGFFINRIVLPFLKWTVDAWLMLSSEEKNAVINHGYFTSSTIFVTKNIVRTNQFKKTPSFRLAQGIDEDAVIVLFAGRLIREKGVYEVVEAFEQIVAYHNVVLILVGDGIEKENLEVMIQNKGLRDKVILTGFIKEQEVIPYYSNSDILVFPTYFPEGFPMALFNSVAAGLSIVTTATRAATDYLAAPINCLWVQPRASKSVAQALKSLISSKEKRESMSTENLAKGKLFSQQQVCAELSATINTITNHEQEK